MLKDMLPSEETQKYWFSFVYYLLLLLLLLLLSLLLLLLIFLSVHCIFTMTINKGITII